MFPTLTAGNTKNMKWKKYFTASYARLKVFAMHCTELPDPEREITRRVILPTSGKPPCQGQAALEIPPLESRCAGLSTFNRGWITVGEYNYDIAERSCYFGPNQKPRGMFGPELHVRDQARDPPDARRKTKPHRPHALTVSSGRCGHVAWFSPVGGSFRIQVVVPTPQRHCRRARAVDGEAVRLGPALLASPVGTIIRNAPAGRNRPDNNVRSPGDEAGNRQKSCVGSHRAADDCIFPALH
ncbi:nitrogen fixation protein NifQ [Mesorhizobium sp. STM 4661]|uniref:nitrogen fixation protein NifQ n=1 Tax=Mesorhizobium sp. STM 4661 TaxID=1297570 RepID=UPI001FCB2324|nr:nitrogen fixation protein NifQ [Mesorhizobium sp. STM 4661]